MFWIISANGRHRFFCILEKVLRIDNLTNTKVGKTTADKLNIKSELDIPVIAPRTLDNPSYAELAQEEDATTEQIDTSKMEIYDVLLAGVAGTK